MILDWLDRILARLLPVRTRNGGPLAASVGIPDYIIDALGGHDSVDGCVDSICRRAERQVA